MKWYEILITDEFIDYFSNENNEFYKIENGEEILAPTFQKFRDIIYGLTYACNDMRVDESFQERYPNTYLGNKFYFDNCQNEFYIFSKIWKSIETQEGQGHYSVDIDLLNAEQIAVLILYPFWTRMGGSFEIDFLECGELKKYLLALKEKHSAISNSAE